MTVLTLKAAYVNELRSLREKHHKETPAHDELTAEVEPSSLTKGIYWPSVLAYNCPAARWLYYHNYGNGKHQMSDELLLKLEGGNAMHRRLARTTYVDESGKRKRYFKRSNIELACEVDISILGGEFITIKGRADAIREICNVNGKLAYEVIYEFKHNRTLPRSPYPDDKMQLNFYLNALNRPFGVLAYTSYVGLKGSSQTGIDIVEFTLRKNEKSYLLFLQRAKELHRQLIDNDPPFCICKTRNHEILGDIS